MTNWSRQIGGVALAAVAVTLLAQAADFVKPDIKPGLWQVTNNPQVSGQMPIPEEALAKLTPEQRARMEAAMKQGMAHEARAHVYKECMTPEKIAKGFDNPSEGSSCKRNVITSSTSELRLHEDCTNAGGKQTFDVHFLISGGTQMTGTVDAVMTSGSRTMTMHSKLEGKWLAASCGSIKDAEEQK